MFNTLRKFFGRRSGATLDASAGFDDAAQPVVLPSDPSRAVRVDARPSAVAQAGNTPASIGVPLKSIIVRLPPDLMQRVRLVDVGETEVFIPTQKILSQISSGRGAAFLWRVASNCAARDLHAGKRSRSHTR
jgi:antitoxin component of MazEF toxin-antitoxin module